LIFSNFLLSKLKEMSFQFSSECFSGECGFCQSCNNPPHLVKDKGNRASDFKKFFSKEDLQKEYEIYLSSLNKSLKNYQFIDKKEHGFTPKILTISSSKYRLLNTSHKCDSMLCQMFYLHLHETINDKLIKSTPIYKYDSDNKFCILCVSR